VKLSYAIDNREHELTDMLDRLLRSDAVHLLDFAAPFLVLDYH
jgi:hypothetical protein